MSTVVDEPLVSAPEDTILFMCRRSDLRLTKKAQYPIRGAAGEQVDVTDGEVVAFRAGVLRMSKDSCVLEDGREIPAAEAVAFLEGHRLFGDVQDGFWRVDPTAPAISRDELDRLMSLVLELDDEKLERLVAEERAGWGRLDLIETAEKALDRVRKMKAAAAEAEPEG